MDNLRILALFVGILGVAPFSSPFGVQATFAASSVHAACETTFDSGQTLSSKPNPIQRINLALRGSMGLKIRDILILGFTQDRSGSLITGTASTKGINLQLGTRVKIQLAERVGFGLFGAAHRARLSTDNDTTEVSGYVAKIGHRWLSKFNYSNSVINREYESTESLSRLLPDLESQPNYPADPSWGKGRLPIVPLFYKVISAETKEVILIKPEVTGLDWKKIRERYRPKGWEDLPSGMRESLNDIFLFARSANQISLADKFFGSQAGELPIIQPPLLPKRILGKELDLNMANLIWIDQTATLNMVGMSKPGFLLFEADFLPVPYFSGPAFANMDTASFEQFFLKNVSVN